MLVKLGSSSPNICGKFQNIFETTEFLLWGHPVVMKCQRLGFEIVGVSLLDKRDWEKTVCTLASLTNIHIFLTKTQYGFFVHSKLWMGKDELYLVSVWFSEKFTGKNMKFDIPKIAVEPEAFFFQKRHTSCYPFVQIPCMFPLLSPYDVQQNPAFFLPSRFATSCHSHWTVQV